MTERVLVLGGTFDPIHRGHVEVLKQVAELRQPNQVWLMVSGDPQLRAGAVSPSDVRLQMAGAVADEQDWLVCDIETRRSLPSYTYDSAEELKAAHLDTEFEFVLGTDAARQIHNWHRWQDLLAATRFVLVNRTGLDPLDSAQAEALGFRAGLTEVVTVFSPEISGTLIRERVGKNEAIADLVPACVATIIDECGLYRS